MFTAGFTKIAKDKDRELTDAQKAGVLGMIDPLASGVYTGTKSKEGLKHGVRATGHTAMGGLVGALAGGGLGSLVGKALTKGKGPKKGIYTNRGGFNPKAKVKDVEKELRRLATRRRSIRAGSAVGGLVGSYKGAKGAHEAYTKED